MQSVRYQLPRSSIEPQELRQQFVQAATALIEGVREVHQSLPQELRSYSGSELGRFASKVGYFDLSFGKVPLYGGDCATLELLRLDDKTVSFELEASPLKIRYWDGASTYSFEDGLYRMKPNAGQKGLIEIARRLQYCNALVNIAREQRGLLRIAPAIPLMTSEHSD